MLVSWLVNGIKFNRCFFCRLRTTWNGCCTWPAAATATPSGRRWINLKNAEERSYRLHCWMPCAAWLPKASPSMTSRSRKPSRSVMNVTTTSFAHTQPLPSITSSTGTQRMNALNYYYLLINWYINSIRSDLENETESPTRLNPTNVDLLR